MGRFKHLVDSEEGMKNFRTKYNIPPNVGIRYAAQGEWFDDRKTGEVVIPMIAFIEGGMTIPMGTLTRNFLRFFRLSPTQCAPNMFKMLGSIEVLNERTNLNLTHHDVNWIYNLHNMKGQRYYLKSRHLEIRLIQCLPISNKGLKEDFLIFSGEWHDDLPCPTKEGTPSRGLTVNLYVLVYAILSFPLILCSYRNAPLFVLMVLQISTPPNLCFAWLIRRV